jgi:hypothetical protein
MAAAGHVGSRPRQHRGRVLGALSFALACSMPIHAEER